MRIIKYEEYWCLVDVDYLRNVSKYSFKEGNAFQFNAQLSANHALGYVRCMARDAKDLEAIIDDSEIHKDPTYLAYFIKVKFYDYT